MAASCAVALLLCELLLYLAPDLQPLGAERRMYCVGPEYKDAPGSLFFETQHEAEGWKLHINNAEGFRDIFDTGEVSVIALGDSFTRGALVNNGEHFTDLLDVWMPTTGVRAYGFGGWGTGDALVQYRNAFDIPHDLVLLGYYVGNDLTDNIKAGFRIEDGAVVFPPERSRIPVQSAEPIPLSLQIRGWLRENLRTYRVARHAYFLIAERGAQSSARTADLENLLELAEQLLEQLREDAERRGADLLIVAIPSYNEFVHRTVPAYITAQYDLLERLAETYDSIETVDLREAVAAQPLRDVYAADGHMARLGQYLIAAGAAQAMAVPVPPYNEDAVIRIRPDCALVDDYAERLGAYGPE